MSFSNFHVDSKKGIKQLLELKFRRKIGQILTTKWKFWSFKKVQRECLIKLTVMENI